jgi:hypothetical protein
MRRHESCVCLQDMNLVIRTAGQEIDFDIRKFPGGKVISFELSVDADGPVCVIVKETRVVEDTGLRDVVVIHTVRDGEVTEIDGVCLLPGIGNAEVGYGECLVRARN